MNLPEAHCHQTENALFFAASFKGWWAVVVYLYFRVGGVEGQAVATIHNGIIVKRVYPRSETKPGGFLL